LDQFPHLANRPKASVGSICTIRLPEPMSFAMMSSRLPVTSLSRSQ
jgi:hypothetical protein